MGFAQHGRREVVASFDGDTIGSGGSGLLLITGSVLEVGGEERPAGAFRDEPSAMMMQHRVDGFSLHGACMRCGWAIEYPDNDKEPRSDPLLRVMAGREAA
jgi:hypothetical protein